MFLIKLCHIRRHNAHVRSIRGEDKDKITVSGSRVGKHEANRPFGRPRHRWEDIRMNLRYSRWESVDWVCLAQDRDQ
jgi:hypothetical protein